MRIRLLHAVPFALAALLATLRFAPTWADEITLPSGQRRSGMVEQDAKGRLRFTAAEGPSLLLADHPLVRMSASPPAPWLAGSVHRILLVGGQQLTGQLLELNEKELRLRTAWSDALSILRPAILAIRQLPGWLTILDEDFESDVKDWKRTGSPSLSDRQRTSGTKSLLLDRPGQAAEHELARPLEAGRVDLHFHNSGKVAGARWLVEFEFTRKEGSLLMRVALAADAEHYEVEAPSRTAESLRRVARGSGWHRLSLRFSPDYLLAGVDEQVLWTGGKEGPRGSLQRIRLSCVASPEAGPVRGEVFFDDLQLARVVDALPHRVEDPTLDEVWLLSGDQVPGRLVRADRRAIELDHLSGRQRFSWGEVRGLFLRRAEVSPRTTEGEHVRVWLYPGVGNESDQLEGVVQTLDAGQLVLRHPLLGELKLGRGRLERLQWLPGTSRSP